ncbi:unnamed protein product [Closterium sp. NIES-53]
MASRTLVSGLPRSLPPLPPGPARTCVPCVEVRQRAAPHSTFLPTEAPLETLHMDVWGPARVHGQGHERYFLLVIDDYSHYTTVFPLHRKCEVTEVLIDWIRGARRQLSEIFCSDLRVLHLHSDRGGESSSNLLRAFCCAEGIRQTFTLLASPQENGIAERRIGMVMDVALTSMIHAAAPYFLWPFAVQYAAHQINFQPRVSLPETTPTLRWTGKVGDASVFRVRESRAFVHDSSADKLSSRAVPCVFLGFPPDATGWQFYHPTLRRVLSSQDVTFDESVSYYHSAEPVEVAVDSGAATGAKPAGAGTGGAEPGVSVSEGAEPRVAEPERVEPGGAEPGGAESGSAEPGGAAGAACAAGATGAAGGAAGAAGGAAGAGAAGGAFGAARGAAGAGVTKGATGGTGAVGGPAGVKAAGGAGAACPRGARTGGTGAAGAGGAAGVGAAGSRAAATRGAAGAGAAGGTEVGGAAGVVAGDPGTEGTVSFCVPCLHSSRWSSCFASASSSCPLHSLYDTASFHCSTTSPCAVSSYVLSSWRSGPGVCLTHFLATAVTDPLFESTATSALVAELVDCATAYRLDFATSLVAESTAASVCPPSIGGECALGTDVLEERQEEFECFAAAVPHLVSTLLAPEGDPDVPDIPTPRSYAEVIEGPYSSQWQAAMDPEMAFWKLTDTYVDEVPPPGENIVSGMRIFRVKRPPGSPPVFKARYVARGFCQRQGVDFFQTFSPTPKMTTLQGSLHEETWLRRPPGFTGSFPAGTQWSLRRPVYGLRQAPREWYDTLRTTLAALGFAPSTTDPSLIFRTNTTLLPFYVPVYVFDLVFATGDNEALTHVKSKLQKRHKSLSALASRTPRHSPLLCLPVTRSQLHLRTSPLLVRYVAPGWQQKVHWDAAKRVLRYPSCEADIYTGAMAAQELCWLTYLLSDLGEAPHSPPLLYIDNKAMLALCQ